MNGGSSGGSSSGSSSSPDNYGKTASSNGYTTITTGSSSSNVTALQSALQATGYYSGSVDGSYGSGTEAAVEAYQRAAGLRVTGMAGPTTSVCSMAARRKAAAIPSWMWVPPAARSNACNMPCTN